MPTNVANPRKMHNFVIEINGVNQFTVQKVTRPTRTIPKTEHGDANHAVKTGGRIQFGDATLEMIKDTPGNSNEVKNWLNEVQDAEAGTGGLPINYKRNVVCKEVDGNGNTLESEMWVGCFPTEVDPGELDRNSDDNILAKVVLSVDRVKDLV